MLLLHLRGSVLLLVKDDNLPHSLTDSLGHNHMRFFRKSEKSKKDIAPEQTEEDASVTLEAPASDNPEDLEKAWDELSQELRDQMAEDQKALDEIEERYDDDKGGAIGQSGFLAAATSDYKAPKFEAKIDSRSQRIDVTPGLPSAPAPAAKEGSAQSTEALDVNVPPALSRENGADLNAMRLDVARISADIQSGEELYRRAQKRIENLTQFVERAEVDFSLLNRLEPENRRLKARNRTLEADIDDKTRQMKILQEDLNQHKEHLLERNKLFDNLQGKLSIAKNSLREYERTLKTARDNSDRNALAAERAETSLAVEKRENEVLRQKLIDVSVALEEKQSGYVEAKKIADSLAQDASDFREQAEKASAETLDLRNALDEAKRTNNAMKSEMVSLHEDIRNFKTQYEFNMISREDEITAMQSQIDNLQKQLDIKDEIVRNAARDVTELRKVRTAQDLERERLESEIATQSYQLEQTQNELAKTKQDVTDFDRRYRDVATALTVTQARRENNPPAEAPDIQPAAELQGGPFVEPASLSSNATDIPVSENGTLADDELAAKIDALPDFKGMSDDDIMDQITDFKLGLRGDIG